MKKEVLICAGMAAGLLAMTGCQSAAEWTAKTVSGYATLEERLQSENEFVRQYAEVEQVRLACTPGTQKSAEEQLAIVEALATQGSIDLVAKNAIDDCTIPEAMRVAAIKRVVYVDVLEKIYQQADATPAVRAAVISSSESPKELVHKAALELPANEPATKIALERLLKEWKESVEELFLARTDPEFRKLLVQTAGEAVQALCSWEVAPYWQEVASDTMLVRILREVTEAGNEDAKKLGITFEPSVKPEEILAKLISMRSDWPLKLLLQEKVEINSDPWSPESKEWRLKELAEAHAKVKQCETALEQRQEELNKTLVNQRESVKKKIQNAEYDLRKAEKALASKQRDVWKAYDERSFVAPAEMKKLCGAALTKEMCLAGFPKLAEEYEVLCINRPNDALLGPWSQNVKTYLKCATFDELYAEIYASYKGDTLKRMELARYFLDAKTRAEAQTKALKEELSSFIKNIQSRYFNSFEMYADDSKIEEICSRLVAAADVEVLIKEFSGWTVTAKDKGWSDTIDEGRRNKACLKVAQQIWKHASKKIAKEAPQRLSEVATAFCVTNTKPRSYKYSYLNIYLNDITNPDDLRRLVKEMPESLVELLAVAKDPALRQELQAQFDAQCKAAIELAEANGAALQKLMSKKSLTPRQSIDFRNVYGRKLLIFRNAKIRNRNVRVKENGLLRIGFDALGKEAGLFTNRLAFYADMYGESRKKASKLENGQLCTVMVWVSYRRPNYTPPKVDPTMALLAMSNPLFEMEAESIYNSQNDLEESFSELYPEVFQGWSCIVQEGEDPVAALQQLIKDNECDGMTFRSWTEQKSSPIKTFAEKVGFAYDE